MKSRWLVSFLLPAALLTLAACGPLHFTRTAATSTEPPKNTPAQRSASPSPSERTAALRQDIHKKLETENYRSALNLLRREIAGGLPEAALAEEYGRTVNGVLGKAEQYRKEGLPEMAGELFRDAHDGFPKTDAAAEHVESTPPEILVRIEECAADLMERGLVAYRAGDLDQAISTWKLIHLFSPDHQPSKKALETAEVQRANLEKVGAARSQ